MQQPASHALTFAVLRRLADGKFHSGTDIAAQLKLSRSRIWQALEHCAALGVEVFRVPGRGYRLASPLTLLDAQKVAALCEVDAWTVRVVDAATSTSTTLLHQAQERDVHGEALAAELQHAGRGRLGRAWHSALGASLTFSLGWRFTQGVGALSGLSLAVGLAVARAVERVGAQGVRLKWPNDLLIAGRKCGGILIEVQGDALGPSTTVIGIGLNLSGAARLSQETGQEVADLTQAGLAEPDRNRLLALLLDELAQGLDRFARVGFAPDQADWNRRDAYRDAHIRLSGAGRTIIEGVAQGVDESGALVLRTHRGRERFVAGEVTLRPAARRAGATAVPPAAEP
jgi:BirA family biotin operon repressor/biotin-[acetyl-CoA-carboxylase] ligase